jgi:UPF0755 protein
VWVTIPEGLRREEIVEEFIKGLGKKGKEADDFRREFLMLSESEEGFLFPDTYLFPKTATAELVVNKMKKTFNKKLGNLEPDIKRSNYTLSQIVTLASIIERETVTDKERPIVAGILFKRLEAGWPLQADAAVQYAVASAKCKTQNTKCKWWPKLTRQDLEIDSLYNTYKYRGLPPGPIANPGLSSIKAAVYPKESPYWFYLHGGDGSIRFASDVEEHNKNVEKYLR